MTTSKSHDCIRLVSLENQTKKFQTPKKEIAEKEKNNLNNILTTAKRHLLLLSTGNLHT